MKIQSSFQRRDGGVQPGSGRTACVAGGLACLSGEVPYARIEMEPVAAPFALLAGVAELADARDSKSRALYGHVGSTPTSSTIPRLTDHFPHHVSGPRSNVSLPQVSSGSPLQFWRSQFTKKDPHPGNRARVLAYLFGRTISGRRSAGSFRQVRPQCPSFLRRLGRVSGCRQRSRHRR